MVMGCLVQVGTLFPNSCGDTLRRTSAFMTFKLTQLELDGSESGRPGGDSAPLATEPAIMATIAQRFEYNWYTRIPRHPCLR